MTNSDRLHRLADRLDEAMLASVVFTLIATELYPVENRTLEDLVDELHDRNRSLACPTTLKDTGALQAEARAIARAALQVAAWCASEETPP